MPNSHTTTPLSISNIAESSEQRPKDYYRVVVMGATKVGKTAIIRQFLYEVFPVDYSATVEELHRGEFSVGGCSLTLDLLDTSGSCEFPVMKRLAIQTGDAVLLVYSIDDSESFEEVRRLHDFVLEIRPAGIPIVVVGNKNDLQQKRQVRREVAETVTCIDWENGFVECSAKDNLNVVQVFKELLVQAKIPYDLSPALKKRRRSLPVFSSTPKIKEKILLKRHSCAVS
ncbi:GTP-binding protein Rhes-like [Limulus polyphemus]|uniref:GTP-binding protein Rhes-like n=1 Tax=Limulus polyphemus TaxID=6850 RepID=A0ABM1TB38_LIMPO|nr:GTP-binding protein Rhes-like [Limulus polyphemus]